MLIVSLLFWTLVALLVALMFAVEAGAASRHRRVVMCTVASTLFSVLYIMFFIEDRTSIDIKPTEEVAKKGGGEKGTIKGGGSGGGAAKGGKGDGGKEDEAAAADEAGAEGTDKAAAQAPVDESFESMFSDCPECPQLVRIPKGTFLMGSPDTELGHAPEEGPQRRISFGEDFAFSRYPVTREQFSVFVTVSGYQPTPGCIVNGKLSPKHSWKSPGFEQSGRHPVTCVSPADVDAYLGWLAQRSGKTYRLPSEAEWEFVARAGTTSAYWRGDRLSALDFNAAHTRDGTVSTGLTPANKLEVYDVHGNIAQWVADCWRPSLGAMPSNGRAATSSQGSACTSGVTRGGSWASLALEARSASRHVVPDSRFGYNTVGIRVARDLTAADRAPKKAKAAAASPPARTTTK